MEPVATYSPDRSLKGKLRRRLVRFSRRRPARMMLERPMVSFTFDDIPASAALAGAPVLEAQGARGTFFVSSGLSGREGPMGRYATEAELRVLAKAGHEIACHSYSHLDCGPASETAIARDAEMNRAALAAWGAPPPASFAYPYGDVSAAAKRALAGRYGLLRALHHGLIEEDSDLNQAPAVGIEGPGGEALALKWLQRAARRTAWLILYTHDVACKPSPWGCTPATLGRLVDEAGAAGFDIVTVAEGLKRLNSDG
jgi:peptidoglycan/xylan/chitin deacetylase (PgdA/CDA1 family)